MSGNKKGRFSDPWCSLPIRSVYILWHSHRCRNKIVADVYDAQMWLVARNALKT